MLFFVRVTVPYCVGGVLYYYSRGKGGQTLGTHPSVPNLVLSVGSQTIYLLHRYPRERSLSGEGGGRVRGPGRADPGYERRTTGGRTADPGVSRGGLESTLLCCSC